MSEAMLTLGGEEFRPADKVGLMPLLRFAHLSRNGVDSSDMEGLAAMYDMLQQVVADDEWDRFQAHASKVRADDDELLAVVSQGIELISQRPTERPSDSSDGPRSTSEPSADGSSSQVIARLESKGRPDLALIVDQAERSRVSA